MYVVHSIGLIIATSPKCASTAINNEFKVNGTNHINLEAVRELKKSNWKVVGVVRDPIDRLESAYNFFKYGQTDNFPVGKYRDINEFIDSVLAGVVDEHWQLQIEILLECDRYADLESLPVMRKENSVQHTEKVNHRIDELNTFYSKDYEIRGEQWLS